MERVHRCETRIRRGITSRHPQIGLGWWRHLNRNQYAQFVQPRTSWCLQPARARATITATSVRGR